MVRVAVLSRRQSAVIWLSTCRLFSPSVFKGILQDSRPAIFNRTSIGAGWGYGRTRRVPIRESGAGAGCLWRHQHVLGRRVSQNQYGALQSLGKSFSYYLNGCSLIWCLAALQAVLIWPVLKTRCLPFGPGPLSSTDRQLAVLKRVRLDGGVCHLGTKLWLESVSNPARSPHRWKGARI